jgi:hypothetical protein
MDIERLSEDLKKLRNGGDSEQEKRPTNLGIDFTEALSQQARQGAILAPILNDEDALRRLLDGIKLDGDKDVAELRGFVGADRRRRLHSALDRLMGYRPGCVGERGRK